MSSARIVRYVAVDEGQDVLIYGVRPQGRRVGPIMTVHASDPNVSVEVVLDMLNRIGEVRGAMEEPEQGIKTYNPAHDAPAGEPIGKAVGCAGDDCDAVFETADDLQAHERETGHGPVQ
jgi:hypothetical protein